MADEVVTKLYATTDAMVWAKEWCKIAREIHARDGQVIDEGWMVGWFANAFATAESHKRKEMVEGDKYVILSKAELLQFFGKMALPPWKDEFGNDIGVRVNFAQEISKWIDDHNLKFTF